MRALMSKLLRELDLRRAYVIMHDQHLVARKFVQNVRGYGSLEFQYRRENTFDRPDLDVGDFPERGRRGAVL